MKRNGIGTVQRMWRKQKKTNGGRLYESASASPAATGDGRRAVDARIKDMMQMISERLERLIGTRRISASSPVEEASGETALEKKSVGINLL